MVGVEIDMDVKDSSKAVELYEKVLVWTVWRLQITF